MIRLRQSPIKPQWPFMLNRDSVQAQGLYGWWPGGPSGSKALYDIGGRCNNGTISGTVPSTGLWTNGAYGGKGAVLYDGSTNYTSLGSLAYNGPYTILAWISVTRVSGTTCSILTNYSTDVGISLEVNRTAGKLSMLANQGVVAITGSTSLAANTTYLVAGTKSGSAGSWTFKTFVNGKPDATSTTASNASSASQSLSIGRLGNAGVFYYPGWIEDVKWYTRALSPSEIWGHYDPATRWQLRWQPGRKTISFGSTAATGNRRRRVLMGAA